MREPAGTLPSRDRTVSTAIHCVPTPCGAGMLSSDTEMNPAGVQVTVQDESAAGAEPGDGVRKLDLVGWLTKDWLDKLKADFPPESRIPRASMPFSLPSDKASCCFLLAVLSNSFVFDLLMNFFSIFSNMAGMVATMDSAMSSVFSGPNPLIPFDEERSVLRSLHTPMSTALCAHAHSD